MKKGIFIIFSLLFLFSMCYYDNQEQLYININKDSVCDTTNVTFSVSINPILKASCSGCHGDGSSNGYDFSTYDLVNQDIDIIISTITGEQGYSQMPKDSPKFDDCKIKKFIIWKQNSMPNN